ncbi:nucleotide disphospho-sugar-binding domain-containing protein [Rhodoferax sp.]|uniref:glycosyltransferase n=1 Tax=Rhodoferax sp. TaxID=50421 RepID=UPI001EC4CC8D|nr:nucleotide disphospho-sugar-binding domain-containing protein [Rhodoferax sp.]MBT9508251.1 hypothetical protein [Rhodoferax sp.]
MPSLTIMFTWEIGQGFGHVFPLLPIARELQSAGHRVIFALRDVRGAGALLQREGFTVLQAPFHPDRFFPANGPQPQSMADILSVFGFTNRVHLSGMAAAWRSLYDLCQPDVVVASYAPLSLLCARAAGIPTVLMALPFELPADVHPSMVFRTGLPAADARADERVIGAVNQVFANSPVTTVRGVFAADKTFMMSYPELDAFGPRTDVEYIGSLFVSDVGNPPRWPDGEHPFKVLAYLNADIPALDLLREEIHASPYAYCVTLRDGTEAMLAQWRAPNVWIVNDQILLAQALRECDAVLTYGGVGFVSASLLAGKPMVFYIRQLEQYFTARQVVKLGAGVHPQTPQGVRQALDVVLHTPSYAEAAQRFSQTYQGHQPQAIAIQIVSKICAVSQNAKNTKAVI